MKLFRWLKIDKHIHLIVAIMVLHFLITNITFAIQPELKKRESTFYSSLKTSGNSLIDFGKPILKIFTQADGLPFSATTAITFDPRGFLWVGTLDGVARYDGKQWKKVNPPNKSLKYITALFTAKDGSLWIGTRRSGVAHLVNDTWTIFDTSSGLPVDTVSSIAEVTTKGDKYAILVGTSKGIAWLEDNKWTIINTNSGLPDNSIWCMLETKSPNNTALWVGTNKGLARLQNGMWSLFDTKSGLPNNEVWCLHETKSSDGSPIIWIGTRGGVARFENENITIFKNILGFQFTFVRSIFSTRYLNNEVLWIGSSNGLTRIESNKQTVYDINSGLPDNLVMSITKSPY
ncbi:MAG: two-component regulator propeller domain-containing protein, partial [Acidobacteriota bacterium]